MKVGSNMPGEVFIYTESDWQAVVEIVENNSDSSWEKYTLKVVEHLKKSKYYKNPPAGFIFEVLVKNGYKAYAGWNLQKVPCK